MIKIPTALSQSMKGFHWDLKPELYTGSLSFFEDWSCRPSYILKFYDKL